MNGFYLKRILFFNEKTSGFTADGKILRLALTVEKVGAETVVKPSAHNLSPLSEGDYRLIIAGKKPLHLPFPLRETRLFQDISMEDGLSAALYFTVGERTVFIAYGSAGKIRFPFESLKKEALRPAPKSPLSTVYEDEAIATENYYLKEPYAINPLKTHENENAYLTAIRTKTQENPPLSGEKNANAVSRAGREVRAKAANSPSIEQTEATARTKDGHGENYNENIADSKTATVAVPFFGEVYNENTETPTAEKTLAGSDASPSSPSEAPSSETASRREKFAETERTATKESPSAPEATKTGSTATKESLSAPEAAVRQPLLFSAEQPELYTVLKKNREELPLTRAAPSALFVRFSESGKPAIAGVITTRSALKKEDLDDLQATDVRLLCYGTPARDGDCPPEDLSEFCTFLPVPSPGYDGYFLLCFHPETGKPERLFSV